MIGDGIVRRLRRDGFANVLTRPSFEMDLTNQKAVLDFFTSERPDYVFLGSARIGGILANSKYPAEFIYTNLQAEANVIHAAWKSGVKRLLFLGSSCIYPKACPQPMAESSLMAGPLEPTSEPYAIAKIAGIRMCQSYNAQYGTDYISAVPSDLYGPGDDFNLETAHVLPSLIKRIDDAVWESRSDVVVWGTGSPRREAFFIDDLADACMFLMNNYHSSDIINIGSGADWSIKELASIISTVVGFKGKLTFDTSKPDGAPRKLLDTSKINKLGWTPRTDPQDGIRETYRWYKNNIAGSRE
jgi:GDP-L-fucose synthase